MAGRLKGKVALVTAAGQGIGRAIAEAFVAEGAKVIATDLDVKKLKGLKKATLAKLDARSTKDVNALVKEMSRKVGTIDVLVNAAGYVHHGTVLDSTDEEWDFAFDLNVRSMDRTIKAALPGMLKKGKGSIVNIASGASSVRGIPFRYVYGTTKAAVIGLTKSVAADYIRKGIRVNAICPGTIVSPVARRPHRDAGEEDRPRPRKSCGRISSTASRWAGSARRRRSRRWRCISRRMSRATPRGRSTSRMAGLRCSESVIVHVAIPPR